VTSHDEELRTKLAAMPALESLDAHSLDRLIAELEWLSLPGGQFLFEQGDRDDSLYMILSGRLGAIIRDEEGRQILIRKMTSGETVGELALLSGEPRSASIFALRDTELVRLSRTNFERLIDQHPRTLRFLTDLLARRLRTPARVAASREAPRTVTLVPLHPMDVHAFAGSLKEAFRELKLDAILLDKGSSKQPLEWFSQLEEGQRTLFYLADPEATEWSQWCLRQADLVLLLADADSEATDSWAIRNLETAAIARAPVELVLLHGRELRRQSTALKILDRSEIRLHHHVKRAEARDFRRLARMIMGRAVGLVLSGGGVRGLSHVGVLRALREAGVEVDLFGGTSMGAIVASCAALGWTDQRIAEQMRDTFMVNNPLNDYTLPMVSFVRGRRVSQALQKNFSDQRIEDCHYPFFCVSSNLSTGKVKIHRTGPIWLAVRASVSVPGVLPPVIEGAQILVDGAVMNNLPVDVMSEMRRGPIIAADVSSESNFEASIDDIEQRSFWQIMRHARRGTPNIVTILVAAGSVGSEAQLRAMRSHVDLLIQPPLKDVGMLNWKAFDIAVEAGYRSAVEALEKGRDSLFR
jgi:NTE family protein